MKRLLLVLISGLFVFEVQAQREYPDYQIGNYIFKSRNNWVTGGAGLNYHPKINSKFMATVNLNIDYSFFLPKKNYLLQTGYTASSHQFIFGGAPIYYMSNLRFAIGTAYEWQYFKVAGFAGPSLSTTKVFLNDVDKTNAGKREYTPGLHLQLQLILKPIYDLGISINPFYSINSIQSVAGVTFGFYGSNAMKKKLR